MSATLQSCCTAGRDARINAQLCNPATPAMSATLELTQDLVARQSVTPSDEGCQAVMARRLEAAGFGVEHLRYGNVDNLWAKRGTGAPVFCFAGHTDVV